jgi:hypothetical protein
LTGHSDASPVLSQTLSLRRPAPSQAYWSVEELAAFVGVPKKSIYRWPAQYPTLPVLVMGTGKRRTLRFPIDRVVRWLRDQEQGRPSPQRLHSSPKPAPVNGTSHA